MRNSLRKSEYEYKVVSICSVDAVPFTDRYGLGNEKRYILLVMTIINKQKMARRGTSSEPSYLSLRIESTCPEYAMSCLGGKSIWKWHRGINRLVPHVKCPKGRILYWWDDIFFFVESS